MEQLSSVMMNQQASAYEHSLLSRLNTIVSVIVEDDEHYHSTDGGSGTGPTAPLTEVDLNQRLFEVKESLQEVIAYCHSMPNAFIGSEEQVFVLLLPILQTYGLMPPPPVPELPVDIEGLHLSAMTTTAATPSSSTTHNKPVRIHRESQSSEEGIEISGMCCSIFCLLLEHSLSTLHALTPSMSIPSTPISLPPSATATPHSTSMNTLIIDDNLVPPFPPSSSNATSTPTQTSDTVPKGSNVLNPTWNTGMISPVSISHQLSSSQQQRQQYQLQRALSNGQNEISTTISEQSSTVNPYLLPLQEHFHLLTQLGEMGWCETLITTLFTHIEDETLCELLLYCIQLLLKLGPEWNRIALMQAEGCLAIVESFTLHCDNISLTLICFDLITLLAETSIEIRKQLGECGVCEAIVEAMRIVLAPFDDKLSVPLPLQSAGIDVDNNVEGVDGNEGMEVIGARDSMLLRTVSQQQRLAPTTGRKVALSATTMPASAAMVSQASGCGNKSGSRSHSPAEIGETDGYQPPSKVLHTNKPLFEHVIGLEDAEMAVEAMKRDPQEIALFCAKTCWLIGRLCDNCYENKTLFGDCDACDVLVQVLRLFTQANSELQDNDHMKESNRDLLSLPPPLPPSLTLPNQTNNTESQFLTESTTTTAYAVVTAWCCYAIGEMSESHDDNQWKFGKNHCCLYLIHILSLYGKHDKNLCILASQSLRQLMECSEWNKITVAMDSGRVGELCINLIKYYMTIGSSDVMIWLINLLATLISTDIVYSSDKMELKLGRMILDCDGGLVLVQVLLNYYNNTMSSSLSCCTICLRVLQILTTLLSVIEHDGNEVVLEEILRAGCIAIVKEIVIRYQEEEEEIIEYADMILTKLAELETNLLRHDYFG